MDECNQTKMVGFPNDRLDMSPLRPRVIAGFGRSGTTWVQDVLAKSNHLRTVFEPLHPQLMRGAKPFARRYLFASDSAPALYDYLHRYFFEEFHSLWADYRIEWPLLFPRLDDLKSRHRYARCLIYAVQARRRILSFRGERHCGQRIVKLVRANMMLAWIKANFDAQIVFIIRHPAAVILSQLRAIGAWRPRQTIECFRHDPRLLEHLDGNVRQLLFQPLSDLEFLTLTWCIENTFALRQAADCGIPVVYYEMLVRNGQPEWERILSALELDVIPDARLINRPSQQAWGDKAGDAELVRQYSGWMNEIDGVTARRIQAILDATGITLYRLNEPLPLIEPTPGNCKNTARIREV